MMELLTEVAPEDSVFCQTRCTCTMGRESAAVLDLSRPSALRSPSACARDGRGNCPPWTRVAPGPGASQGGYAPRRLSNLKIVLEPRPERSSASGSAGRVRLEAGPRCEVVPQLRQVGSAPRARARPGALRAAHLPDLNLSRGTLCRTAAQCVTRVAAPPAIV